MFAIKTNCCKKISDEVRFLKKNLTMIKNYQINAALINKEQFVLLKRRKDK